MAFPSRISIFGRAAAVALVMLLPSVIAPRVTIAFYNGGCSGGTSGNYHEYQGLNSSGGLGGVLL